MEAPVQLFGEAAKSYVELQWIKFYVATGLFAVLLLILSILALWLWRHKDD